MTPRDSSGSSTAHSKVRARRPGPLPPSPPGPADIAPGRRLAAAAVGSLAGVIAGAALFLLGALVYQRLFPNSVFALLLVAVVFGGAGLYAGWLAGMMAFSAVRGGESG